MFGRRFFSYPYLRWYTLILLSLAWAFVFMHAYGESGFAWEEIQHKAGTLSWRLLVVTIAFGLARKLFPAAVWIVRVLPLRKYTGLFAFFFAFVHALAVWMHAEQAGVHIASFFTQALEPHNAMLLGWIGLAAFLPAFLTSTHYALRRLKYARWKLLQRFTHVAFVFSGLHVACVPYFTRGEVEVSASVILVLYVGGYLYLYVQSRNRSYSTAALSCALLVTSILFFTTATVVAAQGTHDSTGVDAIMEELGQEKPEAWESWNRTERFAYLREMGLSPTGNKYRGQVTDLSGYFAWLGVPEPSGWEEMNYDERRAFVLDIQQSKKLVPEVQDDTSETSTQNTAKPVPQERATHSAIIMMGIALATLMMYVSRKTDMVQRKQP